LLVFFQILHDDGNGYDTGVQISGNASKRKAAEDMIKEITGGNSSQYSKTGTNNTIHSVQEEATQIDWGAVIKNSVI